MADQTPPKTDPLTDRIAYALHAENERLASLQKYPPRPRPWANLNPDAQHNRRSIARAVIEALNLTMDTAEVRMQDGTGEDVHRIEGGWTDRITTTTTTLHIDA